MIGDDENESGDEPDMNRDDWEQVEIPTTSLTSLIFKDMGSRNKQDVEETIDKVTKKRDKLVAMVHDLEEPLALSNKIAWRDVHPEEPEELFKDMVFKKKRPLEPGLRKLQDAPKVPEELFEDMVFKKKKPPDPG